MMVYKEGNLSMYFESGTEREAGTTLLAWDVLGENMPEKFTESVNAIYLTTQRNSSDEYWAKEFGTDGFQSIATGGNREIVIYNGQSLNTGDLAHEIGHNYDQATSGFRDGFISATKDEPPPTNYGKHNSGEDIAESIRYYVTNRENLNKKCPGRYNYLNNIFGRK